MHARAFEGFKVWDGWSPVRAPLAMTSERALARSPLEKTEDKTAVVWIARRIKTDHFVWDRHLYPNFCAWLYARAIKAMPVMPVGNPNSSRSEPSTGLTAERAAVEHQRAEPFRSRIDRGREACRTGANDRHVIDTVGIDRPNQPDATGEFILAGLRSSCPLGHSTIAAAQDRRESAR